MGSSPRLRYLFVLKYSDGSLFHQDERDLSRRRPGVKSSWYDGAYLHDLNGDVVRDSTGNQVMRSDIVEIRLKDRLDRTQGLVDLRTCTIKVNQLVFPPPQWPLFNIRPIYFRRNEVCQMGGKPYPVILAFFIGWQANNLAGDNLQQSISIE